MLRQRSDNTPVVASGNKLFTTATPLKYGVRLLSAWASVAKAEVTLEHEPGASNSLADGLSRGYEQTIARFNPARRIHLPLHSLLTPRRGGPVLSRGGAS